MVIAVLGGEPRLVCQNSLRLREVELSILVEASCSSIVEHDAVCVAFLVTGSECEVARRAIKPLGASGVKVQANESLGCRSGDLELIGLPPFDKILKPLILPYLVLESVIDVFVQSLEVAIHFFKLDGVDIGLFLLSIFLIFLGGIIFVVLLLQKEDLHLIEVLGFVILVQLNLVRLELYQCGLGTQVELVNVKKLRCYALS